MKTKLKAFTILELLVVLSLGVIVTGIAYSIYSIVSKQYLIQNANNSKNYSLTLLSRLISRDIGNSERVLSTDYGFSCINGTNAPIEYTVKDAYVLREGQNRKDTFYLTELKAHYYFNKTEIMVRDLLLDEIQITGNSSNEPLFFGTKKVYGSDIWMEGR